MLLKLLAVSILAFYAYRWYKMHTCRPDFTGKRVLITGASSGIGAELAHQASAFEAKEVIIAARTLSALEEVKNSCKHPERVKIWQIDLNEPRTCLEKANELNLDLLDILINNGGVSQRNTFENTDFDTVETLMNTNYLSHVALCKGFMPALQAAKGHIVNISSVAGLLGVGVRTCYSASKFAISGFARALRSEIKPVKVLNVYPGYVRTNISNNALIGNKKATLGKTDDNIANGMGASEAALLICKAITLNRQEYVLTDKFSHHLAIFLCPLWSWAEDVLGHLNFKTQMKAIEKAV